MKFNEKDKLIITVKQAFGTNYPPDPKKDGMWTTDTAKKHTKGKPCTIFSVIKGKRIKDR